MNGHNAFVETFSFAKEFHFAFVCIRQASSRALDVRVIYANIESFMKSVLFIYWFKIHDDWLKQISYSFSEYEWKCQMLSEATGNQKPPKALRYYLHEHSNVVDILN